jgi:hypothetical protein
MILKDVLSLFMSLHLDHIKKQLHAIFHFDNLISALIYDPNNNIIKVLLPESVKLKMQVIPIPYALEDHIC